MREALLVVHLKTTAKEGTNTTTTWAPFNHCYYGVKSISLKFIGICYSNKRLMLAASYHIGISTGRIVCLDISLLFKIFDLAALRSGYSEMVKTF